MDSTISRKFRLADALVLVAATAVGLLPIRFAEKATFGNARYDNPAQWFASWSDAIFWGGLITTVVPCVLFWSLSLLTVLAIRESRAGFRHPGPGIQSFLTTALVFGVVASHALIYNSLRDPNKSTNRCIYEAVILPISEMEGLAIAAVWLSCGLSRQWTQSSDDYERIGRLLGGF